MANETKKPGKRPRCRPRRSDVMCKGWQEGDYETREYPGMTRGPLYMDRCITPILDALNAAGIQTRASCCGHGVRPGGIMLADGREFIIAPNYETARIAERAFPPLSTPVIPDADASASSVSDEVGGGQSQMQTKPPRSAQMAANQGHLDG